MKYHSVEDTEVIESKISKGRGKGAHERESVINKVVNSGGRDIKG